MITYKDFIKRMKEKGYSLRSEFPIPIYEKDVVTKTFNVSKDTFGKILEIECPDNYILSACGKTHEGGCDQIYDCYIRCFNESGDEPFQNLHYPIKITDQRYAIAELIVTKVLTKDPDINNTTMKEWLDATNPILRAVGIYNIREYLMWHGVYNLFSNSFLNTSFNLYPGEKMIFYVTNPDIDIIDIKFKVNVDILQKEDKTNRLSQDGDKNGLSSISTIIA